MPIDVRCPTCNLSFPITEHTRAQPVICPECDQSFTPDLPAPVEKPAKTELPSRRPAKAAKSDGDQPAPEPRRRPKVARDDDDDDDRPSRKRQKAAGGDMALLVAIGVVGLLFLGCVLGAVGPAVFKGPDFKRSDRDAQAQANADSTPPMTPPSNPPSAPVRTVKPGPGSVESKKPAPTTTEPVNPPRIVKPAPMSSEPVEPAPTPKPRPLVPKPPAPATEPEPPAPKPKPLERVKPAWQLPAVPEQFPITPSTVTEAKDFRLPGVAERAVLGGGGRFVILHIPSARNLAVFDTSAGKIARFIPVAAGKVHFAAGMHKLVVYRPDPGRIERFDLSTGEREGSAAFDAEDPTSFCMGASSAGPLLVFTKTGAKFYDPATFEQLVPPATPGDRGMRPLCWASADGRTFGHTGNYGMPNGVAIATLKPEGLVTRSQHWGTWYVQPGPDGQRLYAGGFAPLTPTLTKAPDAVGAESANGNMSSMFLPAAQGPYYMHVHFGEGVRRTPKDTTPAKPSVGISVYALGVNTPLAQLTDTGHNSTDKGGGAAVTGLERRVFLVPSAKLLVVLDPTGEKLRLTPVDLDKALAKSKLEYLFIESSPPGAVRGRVFHYQLGVKSSAGGLTYAVDAGPPEMKVSENGELTWDVPSDHPGTETGVVVKVRDKAGREEYHTFSLRPTHEAAR